MVRSDGTMTNVEQASSTQLDSVMGNGHVQSGVSSQSCFGNGDFKVGNIKATLEKSTFGVILSPASPHMTEGLISRKPDRVKIIVKRKVVNDESLREGRTSSPKKKPKACNFTEVVEGREGVPLLQRKISSESFRPHVTGTETELSRCAEQVANARDAGDSLAPLSPDQSPRPFSQNKDMTVSTEENPSLHGLGGGLSTLVGEKNTSASFVEADVLPATSSSLLSSSTSSPRPHFGWEPCFSQNEFSALDQVSNWGVKDIDSVGTEQCPTTGGQDGPWRRDQSVEDGAEQANNACELNSPRDRARSHAGLEHPQTTTARRTPLCFPTENATEKFLLSSPCQSANPPVMSSAAPAKRSPLPLPCAALPWPSTTNSLNLDDNTVVIYGQVFSEEGTNLDFMQSREFSKMEEHPGNHSLNDRTVARNEDEQAIANRENEAYGKEADFEVKASDGSEADLGGDDNEVEPSSTKAQCVFDEEDDDDFTAGLKLEFGQDPARTISAEALDDINEDDLSYEDFTVTLEHEMQHSVELDAKHSTGTKDSFREAHTIALQETSIERHSFSREGALGVQSFSEVHQRFSFQSLVNEDTEDKGENDAGSVFLEKDTDSDHVDEIANDIGGTSNSQLSDTEYEQESIVSVRQGQERMVHYCNKCGANERRHTCSRGDGARETDFPKDGPGSPDGEDSSDSPDGASPSSESLQKPETSERITRLGGFHLHDRSSAEQNVKVEVGVSKTVSTRSMLSRSQSGSGLTRLKVKMSSEISVKQEIAPMPAKLMLLKEAPTTAKGLLATGILEGFRVRYLDRHGGVMLTGRINDTGIVCDCSKCKGRQTVNVSAFEKHAGSSARHPSDFIYLDNGKNLHEVMEAGWRAAENGKKVAEALHKAMGLVQDKIDKNAFATCTTRGAEISCSRCSTPYHLGCAGLSLRPEGECQCSKCGSAENHRSPPKTNISLMRESSASKDSNANLHKALFVPGGLADDTEVAYYVKGQRFLDGVKKGPGILCSCCDQVVSCSQFEQHAGWGSRRNPYSSIYLADGQSLHIVALALGQKKGGEETAVENVDYCTECGDGGELVLCDSCPGAYHPECAGLVSIPAGNWFCPRCKRQRGAISGSGRKVATKIKLRGSSRVGGTPSGKESVDDRCTRLLKATDTVSSGCVFCRSGEFEKIGFGPRTILLCDQCEREYHVGCLKEHGLANLEELPEGEWFCGKDCQHIHSILNLLVANGMEPLADSIISKVIEGKKQEASTEKEQKPEKLSFAWQLLHGRRGDPLNGKTLSQAAAIFSESFDPIVDESSGRDLIPLMVHSRNIRDQDFGGMHCVVLKRNDEVVTAALVRIFGRQFAELPLVATKVGSTGKGFCKALILSIERLLGVLNVERLVLPAAEGAEGIWVKKFAFFKLSDEESRRYRSEVQMMIFKGSSLLQKCIPALSIR